MLARRPSPDDVGRHEGLLNRDLILSFGAAVSGEYPVRPLTAYLVTHPLLERFPLPSATGLLSNRSPDLHPEGVYSTP